MRPACCSIASDGSGSVGSVRKEADVSVVGTVRREGTGRLSLTVLGTTKCSELLLCVERVECSVRVCFECVV